MNIYTVTLLIILKHACCLHCRFYIQFECKTRYICFYYVYYILKNMHTNIKYRENRGENRDKQFIRLRSISSSSQQIRGSGRLSVHPKILAGGWMSAAGREVTQPQHRLRAAAVERGRCGPDTSPWHSPPAPGTNTYILHPTCFTTIMLRSSNLRASTITR